jgi:hypothetical protein
MRSRRRPLASAVAGVALATAGCSLVTSLSGYAGGEAPAGADAAVDGGGSSGVDGARVDGAPDALAARFCDGRPDAKLCADFDDGILFQKGSPRGFEDLVGAPSPALDDGVFLSGPRAARFDVVLGTRSYLARTYPGAEPSVVELEGSFRVEANPIPSLDLLEIRFGSSLVAVAYLKVDAGGALRIVESFPLPDGGRGSANWALGKSVVSGQWTRCRIRVTTGIPHVEVWLNGDGALDTDLVPADIDTGLTLIAGVTDGYGSSAVWFDDVVGGML